MSDHDKSAGATKKPELTEADKALLEAEPDWERMGQVAKRLLNTEPDRQRLGEPLAPKRNKG